MKNKIAAQLNRFRYVLLGGSMAVAVSLLSLQLQANNGKANNPDVRVKVDNQPIAREGQVITSFAPVVKQVSPSVVKVYITQRGKPVTMDNNPMMSDPMWERFFGQRGGPGNMPRNMPDRQGLGSGVIVSEDGYILTNNHVVEDADEVKVMLSENNKEYDARVVGTDPKSDIAVLKIAASNLPAITLGNSDMLEVGDLVLAIGNPFNLGQTVTMGMVSATGRGNMGLDYEDFIQTDAAINPGNSGGALVDATGRLIGINTAIMSRSGGNQGIGFAVPMNLARNVMENLVEHGRVIRGFLGVNIQNVNQDLADAFKLDEPKGALVAGVNDGSPADAAGIKDGDVIVEFNGSEIRDSQHLKNVVGQTAPGREVRVTVMRDGIMEKLTATLEEIPGENLAGATNVNPDSKERLAGVGVTDIDPDARKQLDLPRNVEGVLVTEVTPGSPAAKAGLRRGDVILEIDRKKVASTKDAIELSDRVEGDQILLRIWSQGASRFLVVDEAQHG
jgi:serine protease Do